MSRQRTNDDGLQKIGGAHRRIKLLQLKHPPYLLAVMFSGICGVNNDKEKAEDTAKHCYIVDEGEVAPEVIKIGYIDEAERRQHR